ncbi:MAG: hypothetical protein JWQ68_1499 [Cryobacterium sp.]|jgi:hypothetical protein|nr:hypothetical protein [Cryobacterium sp.]
MRGPCSGASRGMDWARTTDGYGGTYLPFKRRGVRL